MENALDIINKVMDKHRFRHKRDVAEYFGVTPQALSIWIAKNQIPPKHLLKLSQENRKDIPAAIKAGVVMEKPSSLEETQSIIDYLMRENISLKDELVGLKEKIKNKPLKKPQGGVFDRLATDTLYISGRMSDGIITDLDGKWENVMGYKPSELKGTRYDGEDLIHPEDLKGVKKIEQNLKESTIISLTRYCTIQRWKHGKTGKYIMLSMVWDVNVEEDIGLVVCKPIDGFISA
ncbi:MAG: hypothetical protein CMF99_04360 [Candidatus Marinimicrobia bacterium]|nr:hypothetical protein [Candidatus Neomarinimicrobiota bacterium]